MNQARLARWLKAVIVGVGVCGAVVYFGILPFWGRDIAAAYPEYARCYWPWLIFLWLTAVPCDAVLVCGWKIAAAIGLDRSFSRRNARRLRLIACLAAGDSAFLFVGNMVFLLLGMNHPGVVLFSGFVVMAGVAVTVVAAALSHLVLRAAQMREENELTI